MVPRSPDCHPLRQTAGARERQACRLGAAFGPLVMSKSRRIGSKSRRGDFPALSCCGSTPKSRIYPFPPNPHSPGLLQPPLLWRSVIPGRRKSAIRLHYRTSPIDISHFIFREDRGKPAVERIGVLELRGKDHFS